MMTTTTVMMININDDYKRWKTTDGSELVNMSETTTDFIGVLIKKLKKLTTHSYCKMPGYVFNQSNNRIK